MTAFVVGDRVRHVTINKTGTVRANDALMLSKESGQVAVEWDGKAGAGAVYRFMLERIEP